MRHLLLHYLQDDRDESDDEGDMVTDGDTT